MSDPAKCPTCHRAGTEAQPFDGHCPAAWAHKYVAQHFAPLARSETAVREAAERVAEALAGRIDNAASHGVPVVLSRDDAVRYEADLRRALATHAPAPPVVLPAETRLVPCLTCGRDFTSDAELTALRAVREAAERVLDMFDRNLAGAYVTSETGATTEVPNAGL